MRAPKSTTIFLLAIVLLILGGAFVSDYYPAAMPVLSPNGSPVVGV